MKKLTKLIQSILFGYREDKAAKTIQGGFTTSYQGGSPKEKFNALKTLKNNITAQRFKDWGIEQKQVIN